MADQVLSTEEVDALLKVAQNKQQPLNPAEVAAIDPSKKGYEHALPNICEILRTEFEKHLSGLLRKKNKLTVKSSTLQSAKFLAEPNDKLVYSVHTLNDDGHLGVFIMDLAFLHQAINLLYGGLINTQEPIMTTPGKVGIIITEKIGALVLESFTQALKEYCSISPKPYRTTASLSRLSNLDLAPESPMHAIELDANFDDFALSCTFLIDERFLYKAIPSKHQHAGSHSERDFWRTAIKTQVVDSLVTINVALPDVHVKMKDFLALKEGDTLPISDPTSVYVCLNNIKLFRGIAAQQNSKVVVKILSEV